MRRPILSTREVILARDLRAASVFLASLAATGSSLSHSSGGRVFVGRGNTSVMSRLLPVKSALLKEPDTAGCV